MIKIVFVGDKPSSKNVSKNIPFVGAACFTRLVNWINFIKPDFYLILNSNLDSEINQIKLLYDLDFKILSLGKESYNRLLKNQINSFLLPHPSPLNRQINNEHFVNQVLTEAKRYIESRN
jgi:uracil-DNA glycosylase